MAVVAAVVVTLDVFVYLQLRERLEDTLEVVLQSRLALATQLADEFGVDGLGERMAAAGVPGVVVRGDGVVEEARPVARRFVDLPPDLATELGDDVELASTLRDDGTLVEVAASRAGITRTLRTIVVVEGAGSLAVVLLSGVLLHRLAGVVLSPIDDVVDVARRTAAGGTGQRLPTGDGDSELGRMSVAFNEMLDAQEAALATARDAEQRSRTFLAEAAHQLRTPVAGMRAAAEALALTDDVDERDALAADIGRASARTGRLVSRLLRIAELDEGITHDRHPVDLGSLVTDEVATLRRRLGADVVTVTVTGDVEVTADDHAVREALANLLDNAVRHGRPPVRVAVRAVRDGAEICVADDGPGVDPADRDRVFDRFTSLDGDGTGLGLAVVRAIAEAHGGAATITDEGVVLRLAR